MDLSFAQDPSGETGTVTDTTTTGGYPSPYPNREDAANYLLWSKTDKDGNRTFYNPDFGDVLSVITWAVATAVSGLYEAILLRIHPYDNAANYVEEQESGGIITQYPSIVYYAATDKSYRCIVASSGNLPTDTTYWEEITDFSEIIDNTNIDQEILNVNSDKLIDKCIAAKFAGAGCNCSSEDMQLNNQMMGQKRAAEIQYSSGNIYEYEKIIAELNDTCGSC